MTVTTRAWRSTKPIDGPHVATAADVDALNEVFTEAFTERYRRDGMTGVRVPALNPSIWRYAIEDAGDGALCWRDEGGRILAFNMVHHSGTEGWMGPLCVRPDAQGMGAGKIIVQEGMSWLRRQGAKVIGLETMPRTMDNIGFYSGLGFAPGRLTITLTLDGTLADRPSTLLGRLSARDREDALGEARELVQRIIPGYDFTREVELTEALALGDTLLLRGSDDALVGYALCHTAPLVEGRSREELRVLKLVLADERHLDAMARGLCDLARRSGTRRVAFRVQGEYEALYRSLVAMGGRVRWTDLRMSLTGFPERRPERGVVLSNWEI